MTLKKAVRQGNPEQSDYTSVFTLPLVFSFFCQRHFFMTVYRTIPWRRAGDQPGFLPI
jgi:hypothetical protein